MTAAAATAHEEMIAATNRCIEASQQVLRAIRAHQEWFGKRVSLSAPPPIAVSRRLMDRQWRIALTRDRSAMNGLRGRPRFATR